MPTMKDVAELAGVSVATVSRVLNAPETVQKETRQKVYDTVSSLGYELNQLGRSLRRQSSGLVTVMLSTVANDYYAKVVKGIEEEGRGKGYNVMLCAMQDEYAVETVYINLLKSRLVDGVIFLNTTLPAEEFALLGRQFAIVQCGEYLEGTGVPIVTIDHRAAACAAVLHLGRKRHRIALISAGNSAISTRLRREGYLQALEALGIPFQPAYVIEGNYGYGSGYAAAERLLALPEPPDAIFAISDRMAVGAIKCLTEKGLKVPEDVAVVGFDNTMITRVYNPTVTTVSQSQKRMGQKAMQILADRLAGKFAPEKVTVPHEIIVRASTNWPL